MTFGFVWLFSSTAIESRRRSASSLPPQFWGLADFLVCPSNFFDLSRERDYFQRLLSVVVAIFD
jgi:hypothetical protein